MELEWSEDLATGNELIDGEHQALIEAIGRLLTLSSKGEGKEGLKEATAFLCNYVKTHFAHEEELQIEYGYPKYDEHKKFHDDYKENMGKMCGAIREEGASLLMLVKMNTEVAKLIKHIREDDKDLAIFIKSKG